MGSLPVGDEGEVGTVLLEGEAYLPVGDEGEVGTVLLEGEAYLSVMRAR